MILLEKKVKKSNKNHYRRFTIFALIMCFTATACNTGRSGSNGLGIFESDETGEAIELIKDANLNLKRIRVLYRDNRSKVKELETALSSQDIKKVKQLTDDFSLIINDGYVLAESAKEKIEKAQDLNINEDWKEYLRLKEASLEMQIKAFDFRRDSAKLFRDKFGGEDKAQMSKAAQAFKDNEKNFAKSIADSNKLSKEADELAKKVNKKRG